MKDPEATPRADRASFVGRGAELAVIEQRFGGGARLVTLLGPPGIGKSRLAIRYVESLAEHGSGPSEAGVRRRFVCDLSEARTEGDIVDALGRALDGEALGPASRGRLGTTGTRRESFAPSAPSLDIEAELHGRGDLLVVLDNVEHVAHAAAAVVRRLLREVPRTEWLVTSRHPLGLESEERVHVGPLSDEEGGLLFEQRAGALGARAGSSRLVACEIARRLDGIPLAIELAAGRSTVLSPEALLSRLGDRLELLRQQARHDAPARHGALRAAIDWSWDLLSDAERSVLCQCAVFRGGFSLDAAEKVVVPLSGDAAVVDVVQSLCDRSLVAARALEGRGELRFFLYESIRAYAEERLGAARASACSSYDELGDRHARYYLAVTEPSGAARGGAADLEMLGLERDNLVAAFEQSRAVFPERAVRIGLALASLDAVRGSDGHLERLDASVEAAERTGSSELVARTLTARGDAKRQRGEWSTAEDDLTRARALAEQDDDPELQAEARTTMAHVLLARGDATDAMKELERALELHRRSGSAPLEGRVLRHLGSVTYYMGDLVRAKELYERGLAIQRRLGDRAGVGLLLNNLGTVERAEGRLSEARALHEEALAIHRSTGDRPQEAMALGNLALVDHAQGRWEEAREGYDAALAIHRSMGDARLESTMLASLGILLLEEELSQGAAGDPADAPSVGPGGVPQRIGEAAQQLRAARRRAQEIGHRPIEVFVLAHLGAVQAQAGHMPEAQQSFAAAGALLDEDADPALQAVLDVLLGFRDLARARGENGSSAEHGRQAARVRLERGMAADASGTARWRAAAVPRSPVLRDALRLLDRALRQASTTPVAPFDVFVLGPDAEWFRPPRGERVALGRRANLRRLLSALVSARLEEPGKCMSTEELVSAGWPGERVRANAGANRLRVALTTLRTMGLREILLHGPRGYWLDPGVGVHREPPRGAGPVQGGSE